MKLVKFNATTEVRMIPDEQYAEKKAQLEAAAVTNTIEYQARLGYEQNMFRKVTPKPGEELAVPNWYYEANKDREIHQSVHFPQFYQGDDKTQVIPFEVKKAKQLGIMKDNEGVIQKVKLFELIKDLDVSKKAKSTEGVSI